MSGHPTLAHARLLELIAQQAGFEALEDRHFGFPVRVAVSNWDMKDALELAAMAAVALEICARGEDVELEATMDYVLRGRGETLRLLAAQAWKETREQGGVPCLT